jgi:hypothetical protein
MPPAMGRASARLAFRSPPGDEGRLGELRPRIEGDGEIAVLAFQAGLHFHYLEAVKELADFLHGLLGLKNCSGDWVYIAGKRGGCDRTQIPRAKQ